MPRERAWDDPEMAKVPRVAPLAKEGEPVMLRVEVGQRQQPRFTIPKLDPPPVRRERPKKETREWPASREELQQLVQSGLSNTEIAELYGVTRTKVATRLSYLGIRRDAETWYRLRSMGGQKGGAKVQRRYREMVAAAPDPSPPPAPEPIPPAAPEKDPAPEQLAEVAKELAPEPVLQAAIAEFGQSIARAVLQAQQMGLEVEIRLRVRGGK